jgi:beta-lactamase regulating signal transducer with metallopeptidase domain
MTPWEQALSEALLHFVWQGAAIAILLWLVLSMLRNYSPNARYVASCCGLALLMLLPSVTAMAVYFSSAQPEATYARGVLTGAAEFSRAVYPGVATRLLDLKPYALPLWAAGVSLFGVRLIWSWNHTRKLRAAGSLADADLLSLVSRVASRLGVVRKVQVLISAIADVPGAIGWLRPVLLLPASAIVGLTPAQLEAVLAHELAHIRRHDYFVNLLQSLAEALLFYHPAVWWVSGRIRYERELCCDDLAVELCGDPVCYARALALLEKRRVLRPSLAMGSAGGPLVLRIRRLLMAEKREYSSWRLVCGLGLLAGVLGLALNAGWAQGQQRPSDRLAAETSTEIAKLGPVGDTLTIERLPTTQLLALLETTIQQTDAGLGAGNSPLRWVLFNNGQRLANASSEDEAQAERAFKAAGGPSRFLWFRHEGKTYVSQDSGIVDRILALYRTGQAGEQQLIARAVQRNGELIAQAAPARQAEEEARMRQQRERLLAERSRIEAEYAAQLEAQRAYEQQLREAERRTREISQAFEQQIREANRRAEEINKAEQLNRGPDRRTQQINEDYERQIRLATAQLEQARAAFERQIREPNTRAQEMDKVFEERMRAAEAQLQAANRAFERRETETRTPADELELRIQSMEVELANARAELARELATNANRAQPEVDRALREAIEAGKAKPVQ